MNVLVTGGAGYIGSHTCVELLESGYGVVVIDNLCNSNPKSLDRVKELTGKDIIFYEGDVRDEALLQKIFAENDVNHREWLKLCWQKLKNDSHIYIMTNLLNLFELKSIAEEIGFQLHNLLIWEKNNSVFNRWYMKNCEYTLFMRKGEAKVINDLGSKTVEMYPNPTDVHIFQSHKMSVCHRLSQDSFYIYAD